MIARVTALGRVLRREPVAPTAVAALLERHETFLAFRQLVRLVFPAAEAEILNTHSEGGDRESERVWAFLHKVEDDYFPVYDFDEYDQVLYGIPFVRHARLRFVPSKPTVLVAAGG